jgi:hypothetical protein
VFVSRKGKAMLGVIAGAAIAVLMMKLYRNGVFGSRFAFAGCGGGWRRHHHHGDADGSEPFRRGRARWAARWLFQRLETSPGQEKVILEAWDAVTDRAARTRDEWQRARSDIARAVRSQAFDETALNEAKDRQDGVLSELRATLAAQLARVHEALDERQRRDLADLIELGPRVARARW